MQILLKRIFHFISFHFKSFEATDLAKHHTTFKEWLTIIFVTLSFEGKNILRYGYQLFLFFAVLHQLLH